MFLRGRKNLNFPEVSATFKLVGDKRQIEMEPEGPALHPPSSSELEAHIGMSGSSWQALLSSLIVRGVVTRRE